MNSNISIPAQDKSDDLEMFYVGLSPIKKGDSVMIGGEEFRVVSIKTTAPANPKACTDNNRWRLPRFLHAF